jgi:hypothetical protein
MPLQRSTTGVCHALLWFPEQMVPACSAKVSRTNVPSCIMWFRQVAKYDEGQVTKYDTIPHSTEHDTQPIAYLISKQVVPYRTHGGTCCPGVSTPQIWSLADSSTTCHDGINHLHHSNHCSNHSIDPHHGQLTSRRMEDHLSQRHKSNSTSQRMKDLHDTHDCMTKHN